MLNQRGWPQSWLNWEREKSLSAHQPISQTWGSHGWTPRQLGAPMDKYSKEELKAMALEGCTANAIAVRRVSAAKRSLSAGANCYE